MITAAYLLHYMVWGLQSDVTAENTARRSLIMSIGFMVSRCLSGIGVVTFPKARNRWYSGRVFQEILQMLLFVMC
ncbi:MAG: hypothetical protein ACLUTA_17530 [Blautia wexlerae]